MSSSSNLVLIWVMMVGLSKALTEYTHTLHLQGARYKQTQTFPKRAFLKEEMVSL